MKGPTVALGGIMMKPKYAISLAAAALGITLGVPVQADPPPWAPAHGHRAKQVREYRYVYYPAQQVYYAPEQQIWFWMNGGDWSFGANLPAQYQAYTTSGVSVVLGSNRPYAAHAYVEKRYGRPWREKHKHKEKNGKHRDRND